MATVKELLRNPGPYITALLPDIQELVRLNNPYISNEAARLIWNKMINWGARDPRVIDNDASKASGSYPEFNNAMKYYSQYPAQSAAIDKRYANEVIIKNLVLKLESLPMSVPNAWLEFQKMVDVFYQLVDPITNFRAGALECPPDLEPCFQVDSNFYMQRIGIYQRPLESDSTEGTGFRIDETLKSDAETSQEIEIAFTVPQVGLLECPPDLEPCLDLSPLAGRYFALWYSADDVDVFYYEIDGQGAQPAFGSATGTTNYIRLELASDTNQEALELATIAAIEGTTHWALIRRCPPGVGCLWKNSAQFVADMDGVRLAPEDGAGGYFTPVTEMKASDGTTIATGLITDTAWQNAHNDMRVPYEKMTFDNDVMFLKSISTLDEIDDLPCCDQPGSPDPCKACFVYLETPFLGVIDEIAVNTPGVLNNNGYGYRKQRVRD